MIIEPKTLVKRKIEQLRNGETAFAESDEVIRILKRDIARENLEVIIDETPSGCWFYPQHEKPEVKG